MEQFKDLYIKTSQVTKDSVEKIPEMELLPIFLDSDLRPNYLTSGFHGTAVHFINISPSRYLLSQVRAGLSRPEFKREYFLELTSKDWNKIFDQIEFLMSLCGAKGVVFMGGIEKPEFMDLFTEFLNISEFFSMKVEEIRL